MDHALHSGRGGRADDERPVAIGPRSLDSSGSSRARRERNLARTRSRATQYRGGLVRRTGWTLDSGSLSRSGSCVSSKGAQSAENENTSMRISTTTSHTGAHSTRGLARATVSATPSALVLVDVPVQVPRVSMAAQALGDLPLLPAGGTLPAGVEGVPDVEADAAPERVPRGLPAALGTANAPAAPAGPGVSTRHVEEVGPIAGVASTGLDEPLAHDVILNRREAPLSAAPPGW